MIIAVVLLIAAAFAVGQFFLDVIVSTAVFASKALKAVLSLLFKLLFYGLGFWLLFALFRAFVKVAAIGFAIGFFPCIFLYGLFRLRKN